jgi:hypothetical protein
MDALIQFYDNIIDIYIDMLLIDGSEKKKECQDYVKATLSEAYQVDTLIDQYIKNLSGFYYTSNASNRFTMLGAKKHETIEEVYDKLKAAKSESEFKSLYNGLYESLIFWNFYNHVDACILKKLKPGTSMHKELLASIVKHKINSLIKPMDIENILRCRWVKTVDD